MQPTYLPWLGYFDLIDTVDVFVFLDDVQIVKKTSNTWDCRNRIKTSQGELFLSFPVKKSNHFEETLFNNTKIDDSRNWREKHLASIQLSYRKSPFFAEVSEFIKPLIKNEFDTVSDFNINIITEMAERLGINSNFVRVSDLGNIPGKKDIRLVEICKKVGADTYISPKGASEYIEKEAPGGAFPAANITLEYQNYFPIKYSQLYGDFISHLSTLDLLFNKGFSDSLEIIQKGRQPSLSSAEVKV